jgi:hypothetical protein
MTALVLPFSGVTPISRHHSAQAAAAAARTRGQKSLDYLQLLREIGPLGVSDHDAARMMGVPLSSINSIRNGCGRLIEPRTDAKGVSPFGRNVTLWRLA